MEQTQKKIPADCTLPAAGNVCQWAKLAPMFCKGCGWQAEEVKKRKERALEMDADGLLRKHVSRDEADESPETL